MGEITKERIEVNKEFVQIVLDSMAMAKKKSGSQIKQLGKKLQEVGLKMVLVSSDETVSGFNKWRTIAQEGSNPQAVFKSFCELLIIMRKDMLKDMLKKTEVNAGDVLDILS